MDLSERRELNNGAGDAQSRAFELAVTPAIFFGIGWWLDGRFHTRPWVALGLFTFTVLYLAWKFYVRYDADMKVHESRLLNGRSDSEARDER